MFYPLITPTFTPSWLPVVVLLLVHIRSVPRGAAEIEVILCFGSPGPNLKTLVCQFSHTAVIRQGALLALAFLSFFFYEGVLWGILFFSGQIGQVKRTSFMLCFKEFQKL